MGMKQKPFFFNLSPRIVTLSALALVSVNTFLWADPPRSSPDVAAQEEAQASGQPAPAESVATAPANSTAAPLLSADQLKSLLAPIALYPDELLSQILVASTYPLEVVQAYQWFQQHPELKGQDLTAAAQKQTWDPSVQSLVAFPDVLKRLNQDVSWTTNLGNAFLAQQAAVMDSVQQLRLNAQQKGNLTSTEQQKVVNTTDNGRPVVQIEPTSPEVVYVPDYDPAWIWGPAPAYYPYPYWYYPPRPAVGWCWWGGGIYLNTVFVGWNGWGGWGWHPGWYHHTVVVNNSFIAVNHFNQVHVNNVHGVTVWTHSPVHRMGVAYPNRGLSQQFRPAARPVINRITVNQTRQEFNRSAIRVNNAHVVDRVGTRQINPAVYSRNHSAFGGIESGSNARANSMRGYSSLGHARPAGNITHVGGGAPGAHGGGGGHAGGIGGGGHMGGGSGGSGGGHR
jgi:hypothetical protein